jgi:hypothetical protein
VRGFSLAVCVARGADFFSSIISDVAGDITKVFEQQPRLNSTVAESLASALQFTRYLQGPRQNRLIHSVESLRPAVVGGCDSPVLIASISRKYLSGSISLSCAIAASPLRSCDPFAEKKPKRALIRVKLPKGPAEISSFIVPWRPLSPRDVASSVWDLWPSEHSSCRAAW